MAYNVYYGGGGGYGGGYGGGAGGYGQGGGFGGGSGGYGGGVGYPGYGTEEHYNGPRGNPGNQGIPYMSGPTGGPPSGPVNQESFYNTSRGGGDRHKHPKDLPVHSRLFVVHGKDTHESDLRDAFGAYGEVEDVNMLKKKDSDTRELVSTGVSFVKFKKASQAAKAIEELHGKSLNCSPKPLKILVALSENQPGEVPDDERLRLYIKVPQERDEDEVKDHFKAFGTVEYFNIPKDRVTGKSKGFGYVKYFRFLDAALALEDCEPSFKAIFAQARPSGAPSRTRDERTPAYSNSGPPSMMGAEYLPPPKQAIQNILMPLPDQYGNPIIKPDSTTCLRIMVDKAVDERQLTLLCDMVPGFKRCDMKSAGTFEATFTTKGWAQYASDKLTGFEYPPGCRVIVKFIPDAAGGNGAGPAPGEPDVNAPFYPVDVPLPAIKPTVSKLDNAAGYAQRLFIVCHPCALAPHVLQNAFCRFGDLIDVYTLPGKNFGYAKFATTEAAEECKKTLHRASIAGCSLKVIEAEDDRDGGSDAKRRRT